MSGPVIRTPYDQAINSQVAAAQRQAEMVAQAEGARKLYIERFVNDVAKEIYAPLAKEILAASQRRIDAEPEGESHKHWADLEAKAMPKVLGLAAHNALNAALILGQQLGMVELQPPKQES